MVRQGLQAEYVPAATHFGQKTRGDRDVFRLACRAGCLAEHQGSLARREQAKAAAAGLLDLGTDTFLITATLEAVVAQRLVRRICVNCKAEYEPTEDQLMELALRPEAIGGHRFHYGKGCDYCNNTGYRGRVGLYEFMVMEESIRDLVMKGAATSEIRREAIKRGMRTLRESGLLAIYDGLTTIDEVVRETVFDD